MSTPICDKCNKEFEIKMEVEKLDDGIERNHFVCPHCNEDFTAFFTDQSSRKIQCDIDFLRKKIMAIPALSPKYMKEIRELEKKLNDKMNKLKKKMEGHL